MIANRHMMKTFAIVFTMIFLTLNCAMIFAQGKEDMQPFLSQLDKMGLDFLSPTENSYKFSKVRTTEFFDYESRFRAKSNEMEILIALHPEGEDELTSNFPHLEFNRLLGNLSPNDDEKEIVIIGWDDAKLLERNADWGAEAYMTPRKEITNFPNGKLIAFFKEGKGMVIMFYCFDKPDEVPTLLEFLNPDN